MQSKRLLDRLRHLQSHPQDRFKESPAVDRIRSIQEHIQRILNTRQGSAQIASDFGIPDLTDLPSSISGEKIAEIQHEIGRVLNAYEPRLAEVEVSFTRAKDTQALLRFQITGKLSDKDNPVPTVFEALIESGGKVSITG